MELKPEVQYAIRAGPVQWADYAGELKSALDILWRDEGQGFIIGYDSAPGILGRKPHISRTWLLLAALAIENLVKGVLIMEHSAYISNGRLSSRLTKHNLTNITKSLTTITINGRGLELIALLERLLPSWGRYPVPLRAADLEREEVVTTDFKTQFDDLFARLDRHLYESIKRGWVGPHGVRLNGSIRSEYEDLPPGHEKMTFDELMKWRTEQEHGGDG